MDARQHTRQRFRQFILSNLKVVGLIAVAVLLYGWFTRDSSLVSRAFPIDLPEARAVGELGEEVTNGDLTLRVESVRKIPSSTFSPDVRLTARMNPYLAADYVVLTLTVRNDGDEAVSLDYDTSDQRVQMLLGARRPRPEVRLAGLPREAGMIAGAPALPAATLPPGGALRGVVVFRIAQAARDLSLLVLPTEKPGASPRPLPPFEVVLTGG